MATRKETRACLLTEKASEIEETGGMGEKAERDMLARAE
jgi:hypothetical protein